MHYSQLNKFDTVNGTGIRVSLFVSGCDIKCKGCFNKEAWDFNYGKEFTNETLNEILHHLDNPYVKGLSILGGEPLAEKNRDTVYDVCKTVKSMLPTKDIWLWSGYKKSKIEKDFPKILDTIDVLVDGSFVEKDKNTNLLFRGSNNQKIYVKCGNIFCKVKSKEKLCI